MRVNGARAFGIFAAIVLFCGTDQAQPANPPISDKELVIATKESPPFVMKHPDGTLHGISISLWRRIADRLQPALSAIRVAYGPGLGRWDGKGFI